MDPQTLINGLFTLVAFLGGWVLNGLKGSLNSLTESDGRIISKLQAMEVLVAGEYVKHDALKEALTPLTSQLNRIEDKLDHKADKIK